MFIRLGDKTWKEPEAGHHQTMTLEFSVTLNYRKSLVVFVLTRQQVLPQAYSSIDAWFMYSTSTTLLSFSIVASAES